MNEGLYDPDRELEELYAAVTGRPAFSYTPGNDPLYRSYAERYVQNGRLAMRDTLGQAAALTGGYGSSYAQSVGQQRYDEYLRSLSEALPEFYGMAWQRYQAEGEVLKDAYGLGRQRSEDAYRRSRDALEDERYAAERAAEAENLGYKRRQDSYAQLYKLIAATGYEPTDEELAAAGLSRAQAEALRYEYLRLNDLLPASGGASSGGGRSGSGGRKTESKKDEGTAAASTATRSAVGAGLALGALAGLAGKSGGGGR